MKKLFIRSLFIITLAAVVVGIAGCGRGSVATVNGRKITKAEYYDKLERLPAPTAMTGTRMEAGAFVLQRLINEELILRLAEKEMVYPTDAQLNERYNDLIKQPNIKQYMQAAGWTKDQIMNMIKVDQAMFNIQTKGVDLPESKVREHYDANKDTNYTTPESVLVASILIKSKADADSAIEMLKKGADFGSVARKMSLDKASAERDGQLATPIYNMERGGASEDLRKVLFGTPLGQYTQPIAEQQGAYYRIFKINDKRPKRVERYEDVKYRIRQQLMRELGVQKNEPFDQKLAKFREEAKIMVNIERYKKQLEPPTIK